MAIRARELRILNAIAEALNSAADVQEALEQTLRLVADLLGLRTGWVWLLDAETDQFYSAAARNLPPYLQEPVRMVGRSCWCIDEFRQGKLTPRNIDVMECSRLAAAVDQAEATAGLQCHASIPLYFQGRPLGIMNITAPAWRELTVAELRLLSTIAYQVGIAVERARLAEDRARLARAEERSRIAREIHDTLAQGLTAIALQLEAALQTMNPEAPAGRRVDRALALARESLDDARQSVLHLRAAPLAGKPLAEALEALARGFTTETGIRIRLRLDHEGSLPLPVEAELYRVAQEALTNIRKHSGAASAVVGLQIRPERVRLTIHDDGCGFDKESPREGGHGLIGMVERVRRIGGKLRVQSREGKGSTVTAEAPLDSTA